jgi:cobaltochelatase CobS
MEPKDTVNNAVDLIQDLRKKPGKTGPGVVKVDAHFWEDPAPAKLIEFAIKRRKNAYIVGPTGCGKSSLVINILARLGEEMELFNCSGETSTDDLIGKPWRKVSGEVIAVHGAAVRAYRDGKILLLEEVDHAQPDILTPLHRMLEVNRDYMTVNIGEGEVIPRSTRFAVISTANTIGTGEDSFMYNGTKPLNAAFMNRFGITIKMGYAPEKEEIKILEKKAGVDKAIATRLVSVAHEARGLLSAAANRISTPVSTRDLLEWAELICMAGFSEVEAADYAFLNRANEADREVLMRLVQNTCS